GSWSQSSFTNFTAKLRNTGVEGAGNVTLPANLTTASFDGTVDTSGTFSILVSLGSNWKLGSWAKSSFTNFTAKLQNTGVEVAGKVTLPANLTTASFDGTVD